jgi:hypothetical protein
VPAPARIPEPVLDIVIDVRCMDIVDMDVPAGIDMPGIDVDICAAANVAWSCA